MRPDKLLTTTQGVRGGRQHTNLQSMTGITVLKGYNEPANSIYVDCYTGKGNNYKPRETALINIEFSDGTKWCGTFAQLQKALNK